MEGTGQRNRLLSAIAFPTFHLTTIWLPISVCYPHWILSWITLGGVQMDPLNPWGWLVRGAVLILNVASFVVVLRLLTVKGHRTLPFLINCYGVYPTLVISTLFGAIWNLVYMIVLGTALKRRHAEFVRQ